MRFFIILGAVAIAVIIIVVGAIIAEPPCQSTLAYIIGMNAGFILSAVIDSAKEVLQKIADLRLHNKLD